MQQQNLPRQFHQQCLGTEDPKSFEIVTNEAILQTARGKDPVRNCNQPHNLEMAVCILRLPKERLAKISLGWMLLEGQKYTN